ncbi:hypothetical protein ACFL3B_03740 [Gemmatimonadota bacterium]
MLRTLLVTLVVLTSSSTAAYTQATDTTANGNRSVSVFFEAAIGSRLNRQPNPGVVDAGWYASWELGPSFNRGDRAWVVAVVGAVDEDGARWGIRPRYRRWLGGTVAAVDFGAGMLLGGSTNYAEQHYPGFTGLVGISYGNWLGINLELQTVSTTTTAPEIYLPSQEIWVPGVRSRSTDWAWLVSAKMNGAGATVLSAAEITLLLITAASLSGSW